MIIDAIHSMHQLLRWISPTGLIRTGPFVYISLLTVWAESAAQTKALDQLPVPQDVLLLEVLKQTTPASDQTQQTTTGVVILLLDLEVLRQELDATGQEGNLHLRRPGVRRMGLVFLNNIGFSRHQNDSFFSSTR